MPRASCTRRPGDTASRCRGRGTSAQGSLARLVRSTRRSIPKSMKLDSYRFTHWNAFRAFFRPGFLRSTTLASRVNKPAAFSAGL